MGTSISQPSPSGLSPEGKAWDAARENEEHSSEPRTVLHGIAQAIKTQFQARAINCLADRGALLVEKALLDFVAPSNQNAEERTSKFLTECRLLLSKEKANSLFAELSIGAAALALEASGPESLQLDFSTSYLQSVIDYYVSRDLPQTFGSHGLTSPVAISHRLAQVKEELSRIAGISKTKSVSEISALILDSVE